MSAGAIRYLKQRRYPIPATEVWRLLADTDHLNRTIGLPEVDMTPLDPRRGGLVRRARARAYGLVPVRWREYPFDWIRERRYLVRREFEWGPIAVVEVAIEVEPDGDSTDVKVYADFTPADLSGRVLWRLLAGTVDAMADFCQAYLDRQAAGKSDPTPVARRPRLDHQKLDALLDELRQRRLGDDLLAAIRERITEGTDDQVFRMRPFELADVWDVDRRVVLSGFLNAAAVGLLELRWQLLCPKCRVPKEEARSLTELPNRFHCDVCGIDFASDLDERVELRFTVSPQVRQSENSLYCVGGPLRTPHVVAQQFLRPHESRVVELRLAEPLRLRTVGGRHELSLEPEARPRWNPDLSLIYAEGHWTGPHSLQVAEDRYAVPGEARLNLRNQTEGPILAVVEELRWTDQAATAAEVLALPEMHRLFPNEKLPAPAGDEVFNVAVHELVVVHAEPKRSLFDNSTYGAESGAMTRVFEDAAAAVATALDLLPAAPPLRIGVQRGPVVALERRGRVEHLGRAVSKAQELARAAGSGEALLAADLLTEVRPRLPKQSRLQVSGEPASGLVRVRLK